MDRMRVTALAVGAAAACLAGTAQARGGAAPVVVVVSGPSGPYAPAGVRASVALSADDASVAATEGDMRRGDIIARHALRATDAVVLDKPALAGRRNLPAGTVLIRVDRRRGGPVWCDTRGVLLGDGHDCLVDQSGAGVFDSWAAGHTVSSFMPFEASGVEPGARLPEPAPYHHLPAEARPTAVLGLRYCDGDGVQGPPRFALTLTKLGGGDSFPQTGACMFGVWPDLADKSKVEVGGLHLSVTPIADGALRYKLLDRAPVGPLAELRSDAPVKAAAAPVVPTVAATSSAEIPPPVAISTRAVATLPTGVEAGDIPIVPTGTPTFPTEAVKVGQALFRVPVRHGVTGVLQNRIKPGIAWRPDTPLEVGQPVFGLPSVDGMVWCAPRKKGDAHAWVWETACLYPVGGGTYMWNPHREPAFLPHDSLYLLGQTGSASASPTVARGAIELPAMTLSLVLAEVKHPAKAGAPTDYLVDMMIDWGEGAQKSRRLRYTPGPTGGVYRMAGFAFRLTPGAEPDSLQVTPVLPSTRPAAPAAPAPAAPPAGS